MNDYDFREALEELDREFPGASYEKSLALFMAEREAARARKAAAKSFLIKRFPFLLAGIALLFAAVKLFPLLVILLFLCKYHAAR
jgi:hypothetical protein